MSPSLILILLFFCFVMILVVVLNNLVSKQNKTRDKFVNKIKATYPNFKEIDGNSLHKTIEFENGSHTLKIFSIVDYSKKRKYTDCYICFLKISHFTNEEKHTIMGNIQNLLNLKPLYKDKSIYADISSFKDLDKIYSFIQNYMNKKNT